MTPLSQARQQWADTTVKKTLDRFPERQPAFETSSAIPVERLYTPADDLAGDYMDKLGFPGAYPYTRGVQPTMYRGRFWTMRQYAGFGTAVESNKRYRYLLEQGQNVAILVDELSRDVSDYLEQIEYNPRRLETIEAPPPEPCR